jgi:hypothetical protein
MPKLKQPQCMSVNIVHARTFTSVNASRFAEFNILELYSSPLWWIITLVTGLTRYYMTTFSTEGRVQPRCWNFNPASVSNPGLKLFMSYSNYKKTKRRLWSRFFTSGNQCRERIRAKRRNTNFGNVIGQQKNPPQKCRTGLIFSRWIFSRTNYIAEIFRFAFQRPKLLRDENAPHTFANYLVTCVR